MQPQHARSFRFLWLATGLLLVCACSQSKAKPKAATCDQGSFCRDSDCDTICDIDEGGANVDTDHDGTPNYLDTDSDGDGIPDSVEAGDADRKTKPVDANHDGAPDFLEASYPLGLGTLPDGGIGVIELYDASSSDAAVIEGSGHYGSDGGMIVSAQCPASAIVPALCLQSETNLCDGLDNDCNGTVDGNGTCECKRGEARKCFRGPPGRRGIGACEDGEQVCVGDEFPRWSDCQGGRAPSREICDGLDNDCNGCADEIKGCKPSLACPGPHDSRTPDAKPFTSYTLDASQFYTGNDATSYHWTILGSPCDRLFGSLDGSATSESGKLSYTLRNSDKVDADVTFTLSGAYQITLEINTQKGLLRCTWIVNVRAPGVRVELCWDKTGPVSATNGDAVDLDLHLGTPQVTTSWSSPGDCYWDTCRGASTPAWSYPNTWTLSDCTGPSAQNYPAYSVTGYCPNPRLDFDSRLDSASAARYITENINLDNPNTGDTFRVMVHYNTNVIADGQNPDAGMASPIETHPLVNVYCDGELAGSFGGDPELRSDPEEVAGFATPGQMWRVVDVAVAAKGCALTPLAAPSGGALSGYWISDWDPSYGN